MSELSVEPISEPIASEPQVFPEDAIANRVLDHDEAWEMAHGTKIQEQNIVIHCALAVEKAKEGNQQTASTSHINDAANLRKFADEKADHISRAYRTARLLKSGYPSSPRDN